VSAIRVTQGNGGKIAFGRDRAGLRARRIGDGVYDEARAVAEAEARAIARRVEKEEEVFDGTSTALKRPQPQLELRARAGARQVVAPFAVAIRASRLAGAHRSRTRPDRK